MKERIKKLRTVAADLLRRVKCKHVGHRPFRHEEIVEVAPERGLDTAHIYQSYRKCRRCGDYLGKMCRSGKIYGLPGTLRARLFHE